MMINADFSQRVVVHSDELEWLSSPMPGVARRPLDRIGDEVARATTIVRYDPGSHFSAHTHAGGEEFIVLDGVFQDEHGDYPVGSYVRNPPTSSHTPGAEAGCVIFVKLWQFDPADRTHVSTDMFSAPTSVSAGQAGIQVTPLFEDAIESVRLEQWETGTRASFRAEGGAEVFVLEGSVTESGDQLRRHSWLRVPAGGTVALETSDEPAKLWIKTGHLKTIRTPGQ